MSTRRALLLHSAYGLTAGMRELAAGLEDRGLEVTLPDFYAGRTFHEASEGTAYRDEIGYRELFARLPEFDVDGALVLGCSLGASFAQQIAGRSPGVRLVAQIGNVNPSTSGRAWSGVDVQVHQLAGDPWVVDADVVAYGERVEASGASFDRYVAPGEGHLFTEVDQPEYDAELTRLTLDRIVAGLS
ncbi:carboxymethylenebutenolidase [Enemella evansiae]|uniref:dienelactone hydrolase family protein n=1 Tax=Enemella evansiae TaxID=2016499 RepID=UPI000B974B81|nr:dienelactone hydrolase family protein [Enemella evansiae]OYN96870.1 carboxymethylenebutenolidase [Enemella evansiae]